MIGQHFLKKSPENPSGPGDLSLGNWQMAAKISNSVKGSSRDARFTAGKSSRSQLRSLERLGGVAMMVEKCACMVSYFSWWEIAQPWPMRRRWMKFFRRLPFARRWKYLVFASPSLRFAALAHCLLSALSITAQPRILFLSFVLIRSSASVNSLLSWAMSSCKITCWAMRSLSLAFEMIEEL